MIRKSVAVVMVLALALPAIPAEGQTNIGNVTTTQTNKVYNANNAAGADIGAKINSAVASIGSGTAGVIEVQPGDITASTLITLGKKHELRIRGKGTFTTSGIRFSDSTTDLTGLGAITCPEGATIFLANGSNRDVISQTNFSSLTGTLSSFGMFRPVIRGCTIDGNKTNNASGYGIRLYGSGPVIDHVQVQNAAQACIYTEWGNDLPGGTGNTDMSGWFTNIRGSSCGGDGWTHYGPHDSQFQAINMVGNAGEGWVDGSSLAGQVGNGAGSHIWNMNNYNNVGNAFHTRLGVIGEDIAVSGPAGKIGILLDSLAGPSTLSNVTGAGGIGIECRNSSQNLVTGIAEGNSVDGLKLNGCANSKFDLVFQSNTNNINFAVDNGANQIFANVATAVGQTVSANIGSMSAATTLFLHCNSSSTTCFGAATAHRIQFAGSALGTQVAMLDAAGTFSSTQTFSNANALLFRTGSNGFVQFVNSVNNSLPYMEWKTGLGVRLAYLGNGATNFDITLENGAKLAVAGGSVTTTNQFISTLASGTPPLVVSSNTNIPNLNASSLNGATFAAPGAIGGGTPSTIAGTTISATGQITSTLASGTPPLVVSSNTNIPNLNASLLNGSTFQSPGAIGGTSPSTIAATSMTATGAVSGATYVSASNCSSSASPAVCASASQGSVTVAAAATTKVVNTTAVTANSQIQLTFDSSLGTKLSVTCNTTPVQPTVSARTAGTSFTITVPTAPTTNPACFSYSITN